MTRIDYAFGVVPLARVGDVYELLMVQHKDARGKGTHWSFPKGHKEEGESGEEAAIRELREETGLIFEGSLEGSISFLHSYRFMTDEGMVHKTNTYFPLIMTKTLDLEPGEDEIYRLRWMNIATAKQVVSFESMKNVLAQIEDWLQDKGS